MKRHLASLLAAAVGTSVLAVAPVSPAAADTNVCAGHGTATTSGPLVFPVTSSPLGTVTVHQSRTVTFGFSTSLGTCAPDLGKSLTATGQLSGWCGHSSGHGITGNAHRFAWVSAGTVLVLTGDVTGIAHAAPDVLTGQSCMTGATSFLVTFGVLLLHCPVDAFKTKQLVKPPTLTTSTTVGPVSVNTGAMTTHVKLCV